jgi:GTPase
MQPVPLAISKQYNLHHTRAGFSLKNCTVRQQASTAVHSHKNYGPSTLQNQIYAHKIRSALLLYSHRVQHRRLRVGGHYTEDR